jgi:DNA-binding CsgD family transcriptional regulator
MPLPVPSTLALVRQTWQQIHDQNFAILPESAIEEAVREFGRFLLRTQFLLVYRVPELHTLFCSPGVMPLLGCHPDEFSFEWLYSRVHPDDALLVAEATALSARFAEHCRHDIMGHVFTIDYRLHHQRGHWVRVLRQNFPIRLAEDGKLILVGSIYTDITHHKLTTDVRFHFSHPTFAQWLTEAVHTPKEEMLSAREQTVLSLVLQGLTSQQIAEQLHVSLHTVGTHRRNIHRKLRTRDTSHLLLHLDS